MTNDRIQESINTIDRLIEVIDESREYLGKDIQPIESDKQLEDKDDG